jgi:hypothetical protein
VHLVFVCTNLTPGCSGLGWVAGRSLNPHPLSDCRRPLAVRLAYGPRTRVVSSNSSSTVNFRGMIFCSKA